MHALLSGERDRLHQQAEGLRQDVQALNGAQQQLSATVASLQARIKELVGQLSAKEQTVIVSSYPLCVHVCSNIKTYVSMVIQAHKLQ